MVIQASLASNSETLNASMNAQVTAVDGSNLKLGNALKWDSQGRLAVEVAEEASLDNTLPITAAAVQTTLGNIGVLLQTISRNATGTGTNSKQRIEILAELVERHVLRTEGGRFMVDSPPPGWDATPKRRRTEKG